MSDIRAARATTSLYSLATWTNGLAFKSDGFVPEGMPVIKIAEVKNGIGPQTKFTDKTYDEKYRVTAGDLIFCWSGQPETSIGTSYWWGQDGWLNQHLFKVTPDADLVDPPYFYYLLQRLLPQFIACARNKQTTGLGHVTKRDLIDLRVSLPALAEQQRVASVLCALDDQILADQRIVVTLLEAADSRYLLDARRSGSTKTVGDIALFENNRRVPLSARERLANPGPYPYYGATSQMDSVGSYLFDGVRVLVGEDGSVVEPNGAPIVQVVWGRYWVNNHAHVLSGRSISTDLLRVVLRNSNVSAVVTGAVQAKLSMGNFKSVSVTIPDDEATDQAVQVLGHAERELRDEIGLLIRTRDELLPLLMSGAVAAAGVAA